MPSFHPFAAWARIPAPKSLHVASAWLRTEKVGGRAHVFTEGVSARKQNLYVFTVGVKRPTSKAFHVSFVALSTPTVPSSVYVRRAGAWYPAKVYQRVGGTWVQKV